LDALVRGARDYSPKVFLLGVSSTVNQEGSELVDNYDGEHAWSFFLETPRHLLVKRKLLQSTAHDQEFNVHLLKNLPNVKPEPYLAESPTQVSRDGSKITLEGKQYNFTYFTRGELSFPGTDSPADKLDKGTAINLCSVIKYAPESVARALTAKFGERPKRSDIVLIAREKGRRPYMVFSAVSS